jgi:hypothetical protein
MADLNFFRFLFYLWLLLLSLSCFVCQIMLTLYFQNQIKIVDTFLHDIIYRHSFNAIYLHDLKGRFFVVLIDHINKQWEEFVLDI